MRSRESEERENWESGGSEGLVSRKNKEMGIRRSELMRTVKAGKLIMSTGRKVVEGT